MNAKSSFLRCIRQVREPLSALAALLLVVNLMMPVSHAAAYEQLCLGNGSGTVVAAVDADGQPLEQQSHREHCRLCTLANEEFEARANIGSDSIRGPFNGTNIVFSSAAEQSVKPLCGFDYGARAPPSV